MTERERRLLTLAIILIPRVALVAMLLAILGLVAWLGSLLTAPANG